MAETRYSGENLDNTIISDAVGIYEIKIILGSSILDNDELMWHKYEETGYEEKYLTLKEIYEQIKAKGYDGIIYVWEERPLEGVIYMCGNYEEGQWVKHGTTRGYA